MKGLCIILVSLLLFACGYVRAMESQSQTTFPRIHILQLSAEVNETIERIERGGELTKTVREKGKKLTKEFHKNDGKRYNNWDQVLNDRCENDYGKLFEGSGWGTGDADTFCNNYNDEPQNCKGGWSDYCCACGGGKT
eukprot:UN11380